MNLESRFEETQLNDIYRFIDEKQEENLSLEFKTIKNGSKISKDDKKNYAKALSGFANSSGGIVVWGIYASKNELDIDCAIETNPIKDVRHFVSRLNELENDAVSPHVDGVRHKKIFLENSTDCGFAVTLVPESLSGPHMAKLGEYRYYKRSGDTFYKMEHFDIEDMFGRRKKPKLQISSLVEKRKEIFKITLGIENIGRGSAKAPYLSFKIPEPFTLNQYGIDGNGHEILPRIYARGKNPWVSYGGNTQTVVHPGTSIDVAILDYSNRGDKKYDTTAESIEIEYRIASEDISIIEGRESISLK